MNRFFIFSSALILLSFAGRAQDTTEEPRAGYSTEGYGNNIISVIPLAAQNEGYAAGITYERFLDPRARISLYVPLTINVQDEAWHYRSQYKTVTTGGLIGFKFYPTSSRGVVRYALGLSVGVYDLARTYSKGYSPVGPAYEDKRKEHYFRAGFLMNNSVNFTLSRKVSLGLDLHLGVGQNGDPDQDDTMPMLLALFRAGYRF